MSRSIMITAMLITALTSCSQPELNNHTPALAAQGLHQAAMTMDLTELVYRSMPPADIAMAKQEWITARSQPIPPELEHQFNTFLALVRQPDAELILARSIWPQLENLPTLIAQVEPLLNQRWQALGINTEVTTRVLWMMSGSSQLNDPKNLTQATAIVCSAVRDLDIDTFEDVQSWSFDEMLVHTTGLARALCKIAMVYGYDFRDTLRDCQYSEPTMDNEHQALITVTGTFIGTPFSLPMDLHLSEGGWYPDLTKSRQHAPIPSPQAITLASPSKPPTEEESAAAKRLAHLMQALEVARLVKGIDTDGDGALEYPPAENLAEAQRFDASPYSIVTYLSDGDDGAYMPFSSTPGSLAHALDASQYVIIYAIPRSDYAYLRPLAVTSMGGPYLAPEPLPGVIGWRALNPDAPNLPSLCLNPSWQSLP